MLIDDRPAEQADEKVVRLASVVRRSNQAEPAQVSAAGDSLFDSRLLLVTLNVVAVSALAATSTTLVHVTTSSPWWSYLPASLSALGTVSAFLITCRLFLRGSYDRVRAQADHVNAWKIEETEIRENWVACRAKVFNDSAAPIWKVELRPMRDGRIYDDDVQQTNPDIAPGETETWTWEGPPNDRHPRLRFNDSADRRWEKIGSRLTRLR